jgi:hypothetical protein
MIDFARVRQDLKASGIQLRGGAADEAPAAYKRLDAVLAAHGDTIDVVHRLTPLGVAMAAADTSTRTRTDHSPTRRAGVVHPDAAKVLERR